MMRRPPAVPRLIEGVPPRQTQSFLQLLPFRRLTGLDEQLEPVELIVKHALNGWSNLLESVLDKSTNAVGQLDVRVFRFACQLPRHASGKTGRLERTESSRESQDFARDNVDHSQMFDSATVWQFLAEAPCGPRINRKVPGIV
jgi:hypothetical protein